MRTNHYVPVVFDKYRLFDVFGPDLVERGQALGGEQGVVLHREMLTEKKGPRAVARPGGPGEAGHALARLPAPTSEPAA